MGRIALAGILAGAALMFPSDDVMGQEKHWPALELPKIACRGAEHCGRFVEDNPGWACHMPTLFITGKNPGAALVNLEKPWRRICKRAGLEDVRLHDLRHSFASFGASAGLSLPMIGKMLGHTQAQTTQRYVHPRKASV